MWPRHSGLGEIYSQFLTFSIDVCCHRYEFEHKLIRCTLDKVPSFAHLFAKSFGSVKFSCCFFFRKLYFWFHTSISTSSSPTPTIVFTASRMMQWNGHALWPLTSILFPLHQSVRSQLSYTLPHKHLPWFQSPILIINWMWRSSFGKILVCTVLWLSGLVYSTLVVKIH